MPLVDVTVHPYEGPIPAEVQRYIEAAQIQIDHFHYKAKGTPYPAFVPSDFTALYCTLRAVVEGHFAPGRRFCEWGSGFGIGAGLAAMLGLESYGIEIEAPLVEEADRLAKHFQLDVEFVCGSLVPPGGERLASRTSDFAWLQPAADDAYEVLGLEPEDFDVVFAYPWPGEEFAIDDLFEKFAAHGSILLSYHGIQGMRAQRKMKPGRRRG